MRRLLFACAFAMWGALSMDACSTPNGGSPDSAGPDSTSDVTADAVADTSTDAGPLCRAPSDIAAIPGVMVFDASACTTPAACTTALQSALDAARTQEQALYLPPGDYHVAPSNTDGSGNPVALLCVQTEGFPDGSAETTDGRYHPCVLIGSTCDPKNPSRIVLDSATTDGTRLLEITTTTAQFNINYNHIVRGVVLTTGAITNKVIALDFRAAQGSTVQDTVIDLTHAASGVGILGGPASGGSIVNVSVLGGATGLDYGVPGQQPTVTALTLSGQTQNAIVKGGPATFVGVGVSIANFLGTVAIDAASMAGASSAFTLVDSSVSFATSAPTNTVIKTLRSVYLENVWAQNAKVLIDGGTTKMNLPAPQNSADWQHVPDAALALPFGTAYAPVLAATSNIWTLSNCGTSCTPSTKYGGSVDMTGTPPADLAGSGTRHGWSALAGFEQPSSAIVTDVANLQSTLDAHATDGVTVVLAKGEYLLSQTVHLHAHSRLVGLAPTMSILEPQPAGAFQSSSTPQAPLVDTETGGDTILAYVGLYYDARYQPATTNAFATAVVWKAGQESSFISPFANFLHNTKLVTGPPLLQRVGRAGVAQQRRPEHVPHLPDLRLAGALLRIRHRARGDHAAVRVRRERRDHEREQRLFLRREERKPARVQLPRDLRARLDESPFLRQRR